MILSLHLEFYLRALKKTEDFMLEPLAVIFDYSCRTSGARGLEMGKCCPSLQKKKGGWA